MELLNNVYNEYLFGFNEKNGNNYWKNDSTCCKDYFLVKRAEYKYGWWYKLNELSNMKICPREYIIFNIELI